MIRLLNFTKKDFNQLIAAIPDERFLLQWAGPDYKYPLDSVQLNNTLLKTCGSKPTFKVFKAIKGNKTTVIGHIQMGINYTKSSALLCRILVFPEFRSKSFGKELILKAIEYLFVTLNLSEIILNVYDFNTVAIITYERVGFKAYQLNKAASQFHNEKWNVIKMKLTKDVWRSIL